LCGCLHRDIAVTCILERLTGRDAEARNFEVDEKTSVAGQLSDRLEDYRDGCSHRSKPELADLYAAQGLSVI